MRVLQVSIVGGALLIGTACDSGMTSPTVPATVTLQRGDIVYTHPLPVNVSTDYSLVIGQGPYSTGSDFECGFRVDPSAGSASCGMSVMLNTNTDYWIELMPYDGGVDALLGGAVAIRGQTVTRRFQLLGSSSSQISWNAGLFRIIDGNGTIQ